MAEGKLADRFKVIDLTDNQLTLNVGALTDYYFTRINSLPTACNSKDQHIDTSHEKNFNVLWNTFDTHYAFFESRNVDWDKVYETYFPKVRQASSDTELYQIFKEILDGFHDGHIRLDVPDSLKTKVAEQAVKERPKNNLKKDVLKSYIENVKSYNNGLIRWGTMYKGSIGYIQISDMHGFANYDLPKKLSKENMKSVITKKCRPLHF